MRQGMAVYAQIQFLVHFRSPFMPWQKNKKRPIRRCRRIGTIARGSTQIAAVDRRPLFVTITASPGPIKDLSEAVSPSLPQGLSPAGPSLQLPKRILSSSSISHNCFILRATRRLVKKNRDSAPPFRLLSSSPSPSPFFGWLFFLDLSGPLCYYFQYLNRNFPKDDSRNEKNQDS